MVVSEGRVTEQVKDDDLCRSTRGLCEHWAGLWGASSTVPHPGLCAHLQPRHLTCLLPEGAVLPYPRHRRADTLTCRNRLKLELQAGSKTLGANSCQKHGDSLDKPKYCLNMLMQYLTHIKYFFTVRVALPGPGLRAWGEQEDGVGENKCVPGRLELTTWTTRPWGNLKRN